MKVDSKAGRVALLIVVASIATVAAACASQASRPPACAELLPVTAKNRLARTFPGWAVLELAQLRQDERELFLEKSDSGCPGVAVGEFRRSGETAYAVVIVRTVRELREARLVLLYLQDGGYRIELLREQADFASYPVVHKGSPGSYSAFYDKERRIEAKHETIVFEILEATATVFYWEAGEFRDLLISD